MPDLEDVFAELEERGRSEFEAEQLTGFALRSLDLRYQGQGYELNVPFGANFLSAFHDLHRLRYGFAKEEHEVEVVNVARAHGCRQPAVRSGQKTGDPRRRTPGAHWPSTGALPRRDPITRRCTIAQALVPGDSFSGPAIITEYSSATILPPGDGLHVDALDNLIIEVH